MKTTRPELSPYALAVLCASLLLLSLPAGARSQEGGRAAPASGARYHALVIGNNAYRNVPALKTAVNDARAVEAVLRERYGFRTTLLLDATRRQIINALNSYRRELDEGSSLLVYYAGHGVNDKEIDRSYWLPVDAERDDNANWISADDITSSIKGIPARHVLIVSDSCYSGTLTRGLDLASSAPAARERYLQKMAAGRSRTLMASGGNEPVADGGAGNHSVFAGALLRGLREMEKTQFTAAELYREFVEETVAGRASQTPEYNPLRNSGHENGDFVFARVSAPGGREAGSAGAGPARAADPAAVELSFWETVKGSADPEDFRAYLSRYPSGRFAELARNRLNALEAPKKTAAAPPEPAGGAPEDGKPAGNSAAVRTISGGILNGRALTRPQPDYPEAAKAAGASGIVTVQVLVDEKGRVASANAVSGHPELRQAAVAAARKATFQPTVVSGKPVKVSGILTYNFTLP